jgi:hypothetical protein
MMRILVTPAFLSIGQPDTPAAMFAEFHIAAGNGHGS